MKLGGGDQQIVSMLMKPHAMPTTVLLSVPPVHPAPGLSEGSDVGQSRILIKLTLSPH